MTLHFNRRSEREKRKGLRSNAGEAEQRLWRHLRAKQLGTKFRRQYSVDAYVIDFYAPQWKLAIEVDGDSHFTAEAKQHGRGANGLHEAVRHRGRAVHELGDP